MNRVEKLEKVYEAAQKVIDSGFVQKKTEIDEYDLIEQHWVFSSNLVQTLWNLIEVVNALKIPGDQIEIEKLP